MMIDGNKYYAYPREYFTDSVGRGFSDERWKDFIQEMDKFALNYCITLEKVLAEKYA